MCGITGIFSFKSGLESSNAVHFMLKKLKHRGPDADAVWCEGNVSLGHARLSIIDLDDTANQPMVDSSERYVIVFNGEIYNYLELKNILSDGYNFKTNSDTEVILAAFIKWGKDCLNYFRGIFAFAIWDKKKEVLFLARDQLGVKPIHIYRNEDVFLFSSELTSIANSKIFKPTLNIQGLKDYLKYQSVHEPNTLISGVYQLRAGYFMTISRDGVGVQKYWGLTDLKPTNNFSTYEEVKSEVHSKLYQAIERQLVSDVPLTVFLSGGIDSSVLAAVATKLTKSPINTFSICFNDERYDESKFSDLLAKSINSNHTKVIIKPEMFLDLLPETLSAFSTPSGDGANVYLISKLVSETNVKVALSGLGADELFCGYQHFSTYKKAILYHQIMPFWLSNSIGHLMTKLSTGHKVRKIADILTMKSGDLEHFYSISRSLFQDEELKLLNPFFKSTFDTPFENILQTSQDIQNFDAYSQYSIAELMNYTKNVLLEEADQMSMANGLELRVPLLDIDLVELCLSIPDKFKHPHGYKKLLIDSLGFQLPEEIVHRKKMGFAFPWDQWMRKELHDFCKESIKNLSNRSLFVEKEVIHIWEKFIQKDPQIPWMKVWLLVVLENWLSDNHIN